MDYEVFQPDNEHLAQIIVRFLQGRGYYAGYQLGYPKNKIFLRVDRKEEASKISGILTRLIEKFGPSINEITIDELDSLTDIRAPALIETEDLAKLELHAEPEAEQEPQEEQMPLEIVIEEQEPIESELKTIPEPEPEREELEPMHEPEPKFEPKIEELEIEPMPKLCTN